MTTLAEKKNEEKLEGWSKITHYLKGGKKAFSKMLLFLTENT